MKESPATLTRFVFPNQAVYAGKNLNDSP